MFVPDKVENPFTEQDLQQLEDFITIVRQEMNKIALRVSAHTNGSKAATQQEFSRAFNTLNEAMTFLNVAFQHADYAYGFVQKGMMNYGNSEEATKTSTGCGCETRQECELQNE